jgi:hypothetical protein
MYTFCGQIAIVGKFYAVLPISQEGHPEKSNS